MTTVTGKLIGAANPQRVEMRATLVDVAGKPAVGYVVSVPGEVVRPVPITPANDGTWTAALTANSLIESDSGDTLWAIQEGRALGGAPIHTYVVVPASGGPYWAGDIRADLSDTTAGGGTVVYLPGPQGDPGPAGAAGTPGAAGADGADGASAYQVAVTAGYVGTEAQWLATLVGPEGDPGPQPPLGAAGAGADIALRSTDASTNNARTPTAHKATHSTGGSDTLAPADIGAEAAGTAADAVATHSGLDDPHGYKTWADAKFALQTTVATLNTYVDNTALRIAAVESGTAWLDGLNIDGSAQIVNGDLEVKDTAKGYRFRRGGAALDFEGTGADLITSVWSGTGFNGDQHSYDRYSSDALNVQHAGKREYVDALYGTAVHAIDPATGVASLGGKNGAGNIRLCGLLLTAGAPTEGAWATGDVLLDAQGSWWLCTAAGTPGTWTGGGGGSTIRTGEARITAGDVALSSAGMWTIVTSGATPLSCKVKAATADRVQASLSFMRNGSGAYLDLAIVKDGDILRYLGSGTSTPLPEGNPAYYPQASSFPAAEGPTQMVVQSGEVDGSGEVTIAMVYKGTSPETVYASATYPFYLLLTNIGPEPA